MYKIKVNNQAGITAVVFCSVHIITAVERLLQFFVTERKKERKAFSFSNVAGDNLNIYLFRTEPADL